MDNSVREKTRTLQKLAGTNLGATLQSLRTIYISFIRPVLEYANPEFSQPYVPGNIRRGSERCTTSRIGGFQECPNRDPKARSRMQAAWPQEG
ncbi:hypothetical protein PoB_007089800 [Plakobranchus ocellatus]|uniref:Uncharacterized protein n=1 Tax=Plakobranchus ocellatus TaxID=259542 RepID=A0AAV4DK01_9GAST|nr:hypothetical protein PoB_007089800 [Plakobranchus ocellatus]